MRTRLTTLCLISTLGACKGGAHEHGPDDHGHDRGGDPAELPGQSVTVWTDKHELFMEYRPLILGRETSFAAHTTNIPGFKAATEGTVTVELEMVSGAPVSGRADAPKPAGIFRPKVVPTSAGPCKLVITVEQGGVKDVIDAGACEVFADEAAARKALPEEPEPPGRITYLKEQAWKTEFATVAVAERDMQPGVRAHGEIRPVAGKEARLTAPAAGRVVLTEPVPTLGAAIKKGQVLATVAPRLAGGGDAGSLSADVAAARAELDGAQAGARRAERLLADQAIPEKQVEEARTRVRIAQARVDAASARLGQFTAGANGGGRGGLQIRSPLDGTLVAVHVASGQGVEEGELVFEVMDLERVWLVAQIFEQDIPRVEGARTAWFTIDGYPKAFSIDDKNGRVVTLGRVLDPQTRTVPLVFELTNPDGRLRVGQFARVVVATGPAERKIAIPDSAVIDDAGRGVAFVQVEGESFERRPLTLGLRSNGWVEVREGLTAGEHVVTTGAYEIKLASSAGSIPAHGHVH